MKLLSTLANPPRAFTPIPFWFLNGDLTEAELRRQLADFAAHGVYGVVLHPRIGLPKEIEYLGRRFFACIRTAVETAADLGMVVVLYDEGMYPSGSANGQVAAGRPDLASQGLGLVPRPAEGDEVLAETPEGFLVARASGGTLRGIHWGEDDGEPCAPPAADILNPAAVDRFIALTHEAYYRELRPYFGSTIIGFFTDEPSILGRNAAPGLQPWTHGFADCFTAAGGCLQNLTALFRHEENADTALYHKLLLQREGEVYYGKLSAWCTAHGIALMGHPHRSDDIEVEAYFGVPGQDLVLRWVAPETGGLSGIDATMAKCSADAARLLGRRRNANECFGACNRNGNPWQLSGGDLKWYLDWLAVRGVNLFIPHAFYYSIAGKRRDERPPDVGPHSIWWGHYRLWSLYMRRLSCLMTDIDLHARVAVLCRNRDLRPALVAPLFARQTGFQYLPESVWDRCAVRDGALWLDGRRYDAVLGAEAETDPRFAGAPHGAEALAAVAPDCRCTPPAPALRCARFTRDGRTCWLLVNEGEETIETTLDPLAPGPFGLYDLWDGRARRCGDPVALRLPVRGSLLLFSCTPAEWLALPAPDEPLHLPAPAFRLVAEDPARAEKTYAATLTVSAAAAAHPNPQLTVAAEEMAVLAVNGREAGVGFWAPQTFQLRGLLRPGENALTLTVTGSMANLHGGRPVPYGLVDPAPAGCPRPLKGDAPV